MRTLIIQNQPTNLWCVTLIYVTVISRAPCTNIACPKNTVEVMARGGHPGVLAWLWALSQMQASCRTPFGVLTGLCLAALATSPKKKFVLQNHRAKIPNCGFLIEHRHFSSQEDPKKYFHRDASTDASCYKLQLIEASVETAEVVHLWVGNSAGNSDVEGNSEVW